MKELLPLATAEETRVAERLYEGSLETLMEHAGTAVAELVADRFPGRVAVVCGSGNNGGDGRVCARVLRKRGCKVELIEGFGDLGEPDVIVDALLGIGLKEAPREDVARMIERINTSGKPVVSVDVPSGVDASTGEVPGAAVRADVTVTFGAVKVGLAVAPGRFHAGSVYVASIGLGPVDHEHSLVTASVLDRIPRKTSESTKYGAGAVLVVGGSPGMTGAPVLATLGAFRADAGYVTVAVPESALAAVEAHVVEAVKRSLPEDAAGLLLPRAVGVILETAARADAVVLGPGLGRSGGTRDLVRTLLELLPTPVVLDADALWGLKPFQRSAATVMTPHAGELARLLETDDSEIGAHRLESVRRAASRFGATVLLKGADTLVASPRQGVLVATYGAPSLATAGTGDVLAGVIGAFLAKGLEPGIAAAAGAVAHGLASQLVSPQTGLIARELLPGIQRALEGEGRDIPPL